MRIEHRLHAQHLFPKHFACSIKREFHLAIQFARIIAVQRVEIVGARIHENQRRGTSFWFFHLLVCDSLSKHIW